MQGQVFKLFVLLLLSNIVRKFLFTVFTLHQVVYIKGKCCRTHCSMDRKQGGMEMSEMKKEKKASNQAKTTHSTQLSIITKLGYGVKSLVRCQNARLFFIISTYVMYGPFLPLDT